MGQVNAVLSMLAPGALFGRAASGLLSSPIAGGVANFFSAPASQPNYGVPVENMGTYSGMPSMGQTSYASGVGNPGESYAGGFGPSSGSVGADYGGPADGGIGGSPADADPGAGGYGGSVGTDYGGPADGGYGGSPADADPGAGGYGNNDSSYGGFYNMGGPVDRVGGPNPPGPDDGAGMLQLGEYVIKKSAVKKYGQGLLDMINDGKIPAKKMKSLLG